MAVVAAAQQLGNSEGPPLHAAAEAGYGLLERTGCLAEPMSEEGTVADELDHEQKVLYRNVGALRAAVKRCA
jgi:hypothetical protein